VTLTPPRTQPDTEPVGAPEPAAERPGRQYGLDVLRILAIAGVVAIHAFGGPIRHEPRHSTSWWIAVALDLGSSWTVPVFVMISGALLLHPRVHAAGPAAFYRRRFARIGPAMVVWYLVYLVVVQHFLLHDANLTVHKLGQMLIDSNLVIAFYFLWLIAGLYLIAPVLSAFLGDDRRRALIFSAAALAWTMAVFATPGISRLLGNERPISLGSLTMWWPFVGFFAAGWALRRTILSPRLTALAAAGAVILLAEVVWQYGMGSQHKLLQAFLPVSYLGTVVAAATVLIFLVGISVFSRITLPAGTARLIERLSDASFGVFLVHLLVLALASRFIPASTSSLGAVAVTYCGVLAVSFAVSAGLARIPYVRAIV
jgi:surface polysaccharide O-acyltransferase-like enzyme